jgi:DNA-binding NarL/FixJ family response regulator
MEHDACTESVLPVDPPGSSDMKRSIRTLVADDMPAMLETLCAFLEAQENIAVVAKARDGREALEQALLEQLDLAILDIQMPQINGFRLAAELRQRFPEMRILLVSADGDLELHHAARSSGADGFVAKRRLPIDMPKQIRRLFPDWKA